MSNQYFETRQSCPTCECKDSRLIYECGFLSEPVKTFLDLKLNPDVQEHFRGESYILRKCEHCDLIYQERILNEVGMSMLYNKWLFEGDEEQGLKSEATTLNRFIMYSQELLTIATLFDKKIQDIKLLDYGMGKGQWSAVARDMGYDVTGTDISDEFINRGKSLGLKVLPLSEFTKYTYDFINTEQVFEHLRKPLEVLEILRDTLEPKGIIKISVPYGNNIEKRIPNMDWGIPRVNRNFLVPITPFIHVNTFSQKSILEMGAKLGLKPVAPHSIFSEYQLIDSRTPIGLIKSLAKPIYRRLKKFTYVLLQA